MAVVLLTGMSGAGKSTVLGELARLGHRTVDTDHGGWIVPGPPPEHEPQWDEQRMGALLSAPRDGHLFLAGCVVNQGLFYDRLDAVVLLTAPVEVLLDRVATRSTNPFGRTADERTRIQRDTVEVEPLLRHSATTVVDTRAPLAGVVASIMGITSSRR